MSEDRTSHESIKELVEEIDDELLMLPEFQRDFKWEVNKTYDLFDSLVQDVFIGPLIYGIPSFEIVVREIDNRKRKGKNRGELKRTQITKKDIESRPKKGKKALRLILDGQQRITALYRALKGSDPVWFIARDIGEIDLSKPAHRLERALKDIEGAESEENLSILISDVWKIVMGEVRRDHKKREILKKTKLGKAVSAKESDFDQLFEAFLTITEDLVDLFKQQRLLSYFLLDTTVEKFALFFERSNSKGLRLTFIDILAAKVFHEFDLRKARTDFAEDYPDVLLDQEHAVRVVSYIVSGGKEVKQSYILKELVAAHFTDHWERVAKLYADVVRHLLKWNMIVSQRLMPYDNMIVPMMVFVDNLPQRSLSQATAEQLTFLKYWYWSSLFSERYSAKTNETILSDARLLADVAKKAKVVEPDQYVRQFVTQITSSVAIVDINTSNSALFKSLLSLVHFKSHGSLSWMNGTAIIGASLPESHHIFPQKYMADDYKGPKKDRELVESVANRAYIPKITNIKIGAKKPSEYLAELQKGNPRLDKALDSHLVTDKLIDGSFDADLSGFLADRSGRIYEAVLDETTRAADKAMKPFATK